MYVCVLLCMHVYIYVLIYIACLVHMGYFVMLWGGGGNVVSIYSFVFYVLLFDDFFCNKIFLYIKKTMLLSLVIYHQTHRQVFYDNITNDHSMLETKIHTKIDKDLIYFFFCKLISIWLLSVYVSWDPVCAHVLSIMSFIIRDSYRCHDRSVLQNEIFQDVYYFWYKTILFLFLALNVRDGVKCHYQNE